MNPLVHISNKADNVMGPLVIQDVDQNTSAFAKPSGSGPIRLSSYTIQTELGDDAGSALLIQSYSGAINKVSFAVVTYLRSLARADAEGTNEEAASPPDALIRHLLKRGHLTKMTIVEEAKYFAQISSRVHQAELC